MFPTTEHTFQSARHTTGYLACGMESAPLLIFLHGWPELSLSWRHQLPAFAALGFRCIAPGNGTTSSSIRRTSPYVFDCGNKKGRRTPALRLMCAFLEDLRTNHNQTDQRHDPERGAEPWDPDQVCDAVSHARPKEDLRAEQSG